MTIPDPSIPTLIPFILGIVSMFKPFFEDQREFRKRCARLRTGSAERLAGKLNALVQEALRSSGFDNMTRGDGSRTSDLVGEVAEAFTAHANLTVRLSARLSKYRICFGILPAALVAAMLIAVASLTMPDYGLIITGFCAATIMTQIAAIFTLISLTRKTEDDEDIL